jgi:tRNA G46 methylase TrmB
MSPVSAIGVAMTSREVTSSQGGAHARLRETVQRHLRQPFRRQPSDAGRRAFVSLETSLAQAPFVVDAGCGTGAGSIALARAWPDLLVLGVDKSAARLATGARLLSLPDAPANAMLLRCELVDFWQLAAAAKLRCARQYLCYPNPWPKPQHLMRRWHAHPVLPSLLALGGVIELRSNWQVYADEFAQALRIAGWQAQVEAYAAPAPLTPFERKYAASGHALWRSVGIVGGAAPLPA